VLVLLAATAGTGIVSSDLFTRVERHNVVTVTRRVVERQEHCSRRKATADTGWFFFRKEHYRVQISMCLESEQLPCNRYLQTFLTFLKQERGFADSTIINRRRSLSPFLAWLAGRGTPLSKVTPGHRRNLAGA
jgi:hypothetical protein